jgi:hypothetical protein
MSSKCFTPALAEKIHCDTFTPQISTRISNNQKHHSDIYAAAHFLYKQQKNEEQKASNRPLAIRCC